MSHIGIRGKKGNGGTTVPHSAAFDYMDARDCSRAISCAGDIDSYRLLCAKRYSWRTSKIYSPIFVQVNMGRKKNVGFCCESTDDQQRRWTDFADIPLRYVSMWLNIQRPKYTRYTVYIQGTEAVMGYRFLHLNLEDARIAWQAVQWWTRFTAPQFKESTASTRANYLIALFSNKGGLML